MGIYIEGLEAPKTGSIRIQLYDDGTVWVFQGFGWERQEKKYTDLDFVRCVECKHRPIKDDPDEENYGFNIIEPTDGDDICPCLVEDGWYSWMPKDSFFCGRGERKEVQNFVERKNDRTVCSYGVPANAIQCTQRIEGIEERRSDE